MNTKAVARKVTDYILSNLETVPDTNLIQDGSAVDGEYITRQECLDNVWEWECRAGMTSDYIEELISFDSAGMFGGSFDDDGKVVGVEEMMHEFFRIARTEWVGGK